jgi:hypothetical protein
MPEEPLKFIDVAQMRDLGGKHPTTIKRLAARDPTFPVFTVFGNRLHCELREWEAYKRELQQRGVKTLRPLAIGMKRGGSPGRRRKAAAAQELPPMFIKVRDEEPSMATQS